MNELVSILMSVYNERIQEVSLAIKSIQNQTYNNIEFIIVLDNPENEALKKLLIDFKKHDNRIVLIFNEKNIGLAMSLNKALSHAKGSLIARMDADDISFPDRIKKQVEYLYYNNECVMVASDREDIDESGKIIISTYKVIDDFASIKRIMPVKSVINHPSIVIRAEVIRKMNGYRNLKSSQDYDLWLRLLSSGYKFHILDERLIYYRIRSKSITLSNPYQQYLGHKYSQILFKKRLKYGLDDYSEDNRERFYKKHNFHVSKNVSLYNNAKFLLDSGIKSIKEKNVFNGMKKIMLACFMHKEIPREFALSIRFKWLTRKYKRDFRQNDDEMRDVY